jgi:phosphoribosyl 1,2-cyclic phosphodiesterase
MAQKLLVTFRTPAKIPTAQPVHRFHLYPHPALPYAAHVEEVRLTILGSGSAGNTAYLETPGARVLIDCGLSARRTRNALLEMNRTPERLDGILITHEHSDHVSGLKVLAAKLGIPIYCNRHTATEIRQIHKCEFKFQLFETGHQFEIGDLGVETFPVPHDAIDPVGFVLHTPAAQIGWLTDLGHGTRLAADRVRHAEVLLLETNHDLELLRDDPRRPPSLKQRIFSQHGHLSNEGAADFVERIFHDRLRHIYCAHLSSDCNEPGLAREEITQKLAQLGGQHVQVHITSQKTACETLVLPEKKMADSGEKSIATPSLAL